LGPWIDNPDGKYTTSRFHVSYPGLSTREVKIPTGRSVQRFRYKVGKVFRHNSLLLVATFKDADGKNWPWEVRGSGPHFEETHKYYELATGKVGGLFTYDEPVQLLLNFKSGSEKNVAKTLKYKVVNTSGAEIMAGEKPFTGGAAGETIRLTLPLKERGTFLVEAESKVGANGKYFSRAFPICA
jgi:hypothetical protein